MSRRNTPRRFTAYEDHLATELRRCASTLSDALRGWNPKDTEGALVALQRLIPLVQKQITKRQEEQLP